MWDAVLATAVNIKKKTGNRFRTLIFGKRDCMQALEQYVLQNIAIFVISANCKIFDIVQYAIGGIAYIAILLRCNLIVPKPDCLLPVCSQQTSTRKTSRYVPSDCVLGRVWDSAVNQ